MPKRLWFGCFTQTLIVILGVVVTIHMVSVGKVSDQNTSTVSAVADDWQTIPFVSVRVTDDKCTSSEESMFVREWGGTEQGCLVNKLDNSLFSYDSNQVVMSQSEYDDYIRTKYKGSSSGRRANEPCAPISMKPAK